MRISRHRTGLRGCHFRSAVFQPPAIPDQAWSQAFEIGAQPAAPRSPAIPGQARWEALEIQLHITVPRSYRIRRSLLRSHISSDNRCSDVLSHPPILSPEPYHMSRARSQAISPRLASHPGPAFSTQAIPPRNVHSLCFSLHLLRLRRTIIAFACSMRTCPTCELPPSTV